MDGRELEPAGGAFQHPEGAARIHGNFDPKGPFLQAARALVAPPAPTLPQVHPQHEQRDNQDGE